MKSWFFLASVVCFFSALGFAQGSNDPSYPDWPLSLHHNNRAVAFSSLILANSGSDVSRWKAMESHRYCAGQSVPDPQPIPANDGGETKPPSGPGAPNTSCLDTVYFVQAYQLVECADGRAYIVRSGEGVDLKSPMEGQTFQWSEAVACQSPWLRSGNAMDPQRPLELDQIRRN